MRILMVTTFYPPCHLGGDAIYVRALSRQLASLGHEVEVVCCQDAFNLSGQPTKPEESSDDGVTVHRLKHPLGIMSPLITQQTGFPGLKARALRRLLQRRFDLVHYHNISLIGGPGVLRLGEADVKLLTLHDHWLLCPTHIFWKNRQRPCDRPSCLSCSIRSGIPPQLWRLTPLMKNCLRHVDSLLACSHFTADLLHGAGFPTPIEILPLFSSIDPGAQVSEGGDDGYYLYVGRIETSKGIEPLLENFAANPQRELRVVGDGDRRAELHSRYAVRPNIHFMGWRTRDELVALYRRARALIQPSLAPETFGLNIVEALACGTPALVHSAGGNGEIIDATGAGFVYRNDIELEQALARLDSDETLVSHLRGLARAGFEQNYSARRHLESYLALVERLRTAARRHESDRNRGSR